MLTRSLVCMLFALLATTAGLIYQSRYAQADSQWTVDEVNLTWPKPSPTPAGEDTLITGTIRNTHGAAINSATVSLKGRSGYVTNLVTTGPDGKYTFRPLPSGRFTVKAEHRNYRSQTKVVKLDPGQQQLLNFNLAEK